MAFAYTPEPAQYDFAGTRAIAIYTDARPTGDGDAFGSGKLSAQQRTDSKADDLEKLEASSSKNVATANVVPVDCTATDSPASSTATANGKENAVSHTELKRIYRRAAWYSLALTLIVAILGSSPSSSSVSYLPLPA